MDLIDHANRSADLMLQVQIERQKKKQKTKINTSGLCAECDSHIEPKRLEANKHAFRCIECQKEHEGR